MELTACGIRGNASALAVAIGRLEDTLCVLYFKNMYLISIKLGKLYLHDLKMPYAPILLTICLNNLISNKKIVKFLYQTSFAL